MNAGSERLTEPLNDLTVPLSLSVRQVVLGSNFREALQLDLVCCTQRACAYYTLAMRPEKSLPSDSMPGLNPFVLITASGQTPVGDGREESSRLQSAAICCCTSCVRIKGD